MESPRFNDEPVGSWSSDDLERCLLWGVEQGMSDLALVPSQPVWVRIHGAWHAVTNRLLTTIEISTILDTISRVSSSSTNVRGGDDYDFAFEFKVKGERFKRKRFRVNASCCRDGFDKGVSMVLRTIPEFPPKLEELDIEPDLLKALFPVNGLVLVTGVMGTGKSTTLSAVLRHILETQRRHVLTYESPIEFDLMGLPERKGPVAQTAVPEHLQSFSIAPRNSARRAADVILVGESRDPETLRGMLEAAEIGVAAYSTVHTRNVAETLSRIINVFPANMQAQIASTLFSSIRVVVQQRLLPALAGGRVAIREFLVFTPELRAKLFKVPLEQLIPVVHEMVQKHGQPLLQAARIKLEKGMISEESFELIRSEVEADDVD